MQWLVTLETDSDVITACRLLNAFRRKGLKISTLAMATRPAGFSVMAVVDSHESVIEHMFNFLRRTEGVEHVTCYRHETSADASFLFVDADPATSRVAQILEAFPESELIFASHGKYLLEVPAEGRHRAPAVQPGEPGVLSFARVKTTLSAPQPGLITARAS